MQQAATRAQQVPSSAADGDAAPGVLRNAFVINLTSSTSPVALTRPEHAGLNRFNFFVSRRREEGRERFRLHMGYFETQEEAEKLLDIVREIYPGAWAGLAPGRGLRGTPPVPQPDQAAPAAESSVTSQASRASQPSAPSRASERGASPPASQPAARIGAARADTAPTVDRRARAANDRQAAAHSLGNVRAAIDSLEDSAGAAAAAAVRPEAIREAAREAPRVVPTLRPAPSIPTLKPVASPVPVARAAAPAPAPTQIISRPAPQRAELKEPAVLKLLEGAARTAGKASTAPPEIEKPCFAVQLAWSVEPIDLTRVPQLAIFNAYTLYGAQGHREGRRWYGLRLGFFTDAVSAKQVAQYVRADFATVSVVPVSTRERDQAKRAIEAVTAPNPATVVPVPGAARPARATASLDEFKFIDDAADALPGVPSRKSREASGDGKPVLPTRTGRGAPGKRAVFRAGRVHAARKTRQMTLEETLEILGANDLEVDARKKRATDGVEAPEIPAPAVPPSGKPSKLSRLFERLSERLGT